jgi:DNA-directed RNA polymerase specialized sigma24 family protein
MDENWPLFAARLSGRALTDNEALLLKASCRLWPAALATVTSRVSKTPGLPLDPKSITTECWEDALSSTLETMGKLGATKISDLDSYLFAIFSFRLNRYLAQQRKRRKIIEFVPGDNELEDLDGAKDTSSVEKIESGIALQQALSKSDDSFRAMAWLYCHYFKWDQIGAIFGVTGEQARKRFEYGVQKLRRLLQIPPEEEDEPE